MARRGKHNEDHFAHKNTEVERPCTYSSETYRHAKAKQLLVARLRVQVPAVYAAIPVGFEGKVPRLAEACEVVAATAVSEQNVYVDEQGEVQFERHHSLPFDDHQGKRQLLARPDVVFYDQDKNPILFIEIWATHRSTDVKLARLYMLGSDTIEIYIPQHCDPAAIEALFSFTSQTKWLYNAQQAAYQFTPFSTGLLGTGSASTTELAPQLSDQQETLQCRLNRVKNAIRAFERMLGRTDVRNAHQELSEAERTGQEFTARLEAQRAERDERLGTTVRQRMVAHRLAFTEREQEIRREQQAARAAAGELAAHITGKENQLVRVLAYLTARTEAATKAAQRTYYRITDGISSAKYRIREQQRTIERELADLERLEKQLSLEAAKLDREEAELREQEERLDREEATYRRGKERRLSDLREAERSTQYFKKCEAELQQLEGEAPKHR